MELTTINAVRRIRKMYLDASPILKSMLPYDLMDKEHMDVLDTLIITKLTDFLNNISTDEVKAIEELLATPFGERIMTLACATCAATQTYIYYGIAGKLANAKR
jgi:hypothetical protein